LDAIKQAGNSDDHVVEIPNDIYFLVVGMVVQGVSDVTIQLNGQLVFLDNIKSYLMAPRNLKYMDLWAWNDCHHITMIGSSGSSIDGSGYNWWMQSLLQPVKMSDLVTDVRPKLLSFEKSSELTLDFSPFSTAPSSILA
jgi:hypothetical protein